MTFAIEAFAALAAIVVAAVALTIARPRAEATQQLAAQTKFPCGQFRVTFFEHECHLIQVNVGICRCAEMGVWRRHGCVLRLAPSERVDAEN